MKPDIHPQYFQAKVTCASCGTTWTTGSTKKELRVDICSNCHPFFTGEAARIMDIEGQVDRFYKKLQAAQTHVDAKKEREAAKNSPDRSVEDLELSGRAVEALKKAGIETVAQLIEKMAQGDEALLSIQGFAQSSLTTVKKKLRAFGYELPQAAA